MKTVMFIIMIVTLGFFGSAYADATPTETYPYNGAIYNANTGVLYNSIQDALDDAICGDAIEVCSGRYVGGLVITKTVDLIGIDTGGGMPVLEGLGITGIDVQSQAIGTTVRGINVSDYWYGIYVSGSCCTLLDNYVHGNADGIYIDGPCNVVSGNTVSFNDWGIYCCNIHNVITRNLVRGNDYGIYLDEPQNAIKNNRVFNNYSADIYPR
jgi:parallel beta-helix repeat protein